MHVPVLLHESIDALNLSSGETVVDCTLNRGGHSKLIAERIGETGTLIGIDLDNHAIEEAKEILSALPHAPKTYFVNGNFRDLSGHLQNLGITSVHAVLADLGISSQELDSSGRGFTFRYDEPLLLTLASHPEEGDTTGVDIVNSWSEESIADILYGFADEVYSRRIARAIVKERSVAPILTTYDLVRVVEGAVPAAYRHKKTHPATKTFQAIRMAVNDEIGAIKDLIAALPHVLPPSRRASIITFHSTEDRLTKEAVRSHSDTLTFVNKKAIMPSEAEVRKNPRARSAQLRIIERL